jgi:hypothetical protein
LRSVIGFPQGKPGAGNLAAGVEHRIGEAACHEAAHHLAPVGDAAARADVLDRQQRGLGDHVRRHLPAGKEGFDFSEPLRHRADAADGHARRGKAGAGLVGFDQHGEADDGDHQRAAVPDLLEGAAPARQGIALDGHQQFVLLQHRLAGADDEFGQRHAAPADFAVATRGQFDHRIVGEQRRRAVGGRRGIHQIAADGGGLADLVVGEPHRAARHLGQRLHQHRIVEEALHRRRRAEADPIAVTPARRHLGDSRDVDEDRDVDVVGPALARPRQESVDPATTRQLPRFSPSASNASSRVCGRR